MCGQCPVDHRLTWTWVLTLQLLSFSLITVISVLLAHQNSMIYKQTAESSICSTLSRTSRRLINRSKQHLSKKISVVSFHIILIYTYLYVITVVKMSKCAYVHPSLVARSVQLMCYSFNHLEFNCQFPYKRSILCQCLKIN